VEDGGMTLTAFQAWLLAALVGIGTLRLAHLNRKPPES
jgi:hypothetical protein